MLGNEFVPLPIHFWNSFAPLGPRWGIEAKRAFADAYRKTLVVMGPIQEIPEPGCAGDARPFGARSFRYSGRAAIGPRASRRACVRRRCCRRKRSNGCVRRVRRRLRSWGSEYGNVLSAGQHQAGTCRMGVDPRHSVTDRDGRVHDQRTLYRGGRVAARHQRRFQSGAHHHGECVPDRDRRWPERCARDAVPAICALMRQCRVRSSVRE